MTHSLELLPAIEEIAARQAQKNGKSVEEYLPELVQRALVQQEAPESSAANETLKTGADLLALWEREGMFLPGEDMPDSPAYARQIRETSQGARGI